MTTDSEEEVGTSVPVPTSASASAQSTQITTENRIVSASKTGYTTGVTGVTGVTATNRTTFVRTETDSNTITSVKASATNIANNSCRMIKANSVTSPFAKFRQLERQNSLPSSASGLAITTAKTATSSAHNVRVSKFDDSKLCRSASSIKDRLLNWVKAQTKDYKNIQIDNFSSSWNNGLAFCALIHHFYPYAFDYDKLTPQQRRFNFELAFRVAEQEAGIAPLLDVDDMVTMKRPDWKCVFTYVQTIYQRFHASPQANTAAVL